MAILWIIAGLVGLVLASELAVTGARAAADRLGRSHMTVGLTIAAIGTSLPEIATNVGAALVDDASQGSGIAVGNIVGSCLSQITLLLGVTALVRPLSMSWSEARRDGLAVIGALGLMALVVADGAASQIEGALLVLCYALYLIYTWRRGEAAPQDDAEGPRRTPIGIALLQVSGGLALLVFSADLLVDNAVRVAVDMGVAEDKIGLAVGVATGLPELAFAIQGARRGDTGLAVGNLLGSNITDPLASFGIGVTLRQVQVPDQVLHTDIPLWAVSTCLALWLMTRPGGLQKRHGVALALGFVVYSVARGMS